MTGSHRTTRRRHYSRREHWLSGRPGLRAGDLAVRSGQVTDPDASRDVGAQLEASGGASAPLRPGGADSPLGITGTTSAPATT